VSKWPAAALTEPPSPPRVSLSAQSREVAGACNMSALSGREVSGEHRLALPESR
jgi:hypothetical protein